MNVVNPSSKGTKKATNLSLDSDLLREARALGINISRACEAGLAHNFTQIREARWLADNAEAIEFSNAYVDQHGLPLERYRAF